MSKKSTKKKVSAQKKQGHYWLIGLLTFFCIILLVIFTFITSNEIRYRNKILPGVTVGNIEVGNLTAAAATRLIQTKTDELLTQGLVFSYDNEKINIQNSLQSLSDPDINIDIIKYQIEPASQQALAIGHSPQTLKRLADQFKLIFNNYNITVTADINYEEIQNIVNRDMKQIVTPTQSAGITLAGSDITITPAIPGQIIDWDNAWALLDLQTQNLLPAAVPLSLIYEKPLVSKSEAEANINKLTLLIEQKPELSLTGDEFDESVPWSKIKPWLEWTKTDNEIFVTLNADSLNEYLSALSQDINELTRDAKFEIKNGRVVKFQGSQDGRELNIPATIKLIRDNFTQEIYDNELIITQKKAKVATTDVNNLGIREIIGVGSSNFAGSPPNRRHNIKVGADALNGLLIKPGEEFSLLNALGDIDAAAGYLTELVIKGNKTVPEYGGGLCQIGTTIFRATLASGLPILARRNHSYRIPYYEPAGTDATIYDPAPDYKFLNDTNTYVLIQTRIAGDELIFEFWGTNDGRQVEQTKPIIYNITPAPPTKYIETLDLEPGEEKCTESAHAGADAEFTYTVTYTDGETKTKTFKSHYRPWQAVCLVGVAELSETEISNKTDNATTTDTVQIP